MKLFVSARQMSPGKIIFVLFWITFVVPRQIKHGTVFALSLTTGQSNLSIVFIFVSCAEEEYYRVVSEGQLGSNCLSYCGRSRRVHRIQNQHT